jgi:Ras-related protein Rab-7A
MNKILKKVVILGDSSVGKTSLMNQYVNHEFSTKYKATIGADFETSTLTIDNKTISLQIWDTAGQERFQSLVESFYRGADACMLVFDVNVQSTFDNLPNWRADFLIKSGNSEEFPFVVVANKIDLTKNIDRAVSKQTCEEWAASIGAVYYETSAKDGSNVPKAFEELAKLTLGQDKTSIKDTITFENTKNPTSEPTSRCSC